MSSSVHIDNKNKDILIFGGGLTEGLDDTTLKAEANYLINFTQSEIKFVLSLHYMKVTVSHLLLLQKYINSKQKIRK